MPRPPRLGPYAPLSASAYQDDALLAAGPDAELLFYRSLQFSAGAAADGYFTDRQVLLFGVGLRAIPRATQALVREGVWVQVEGGYSVRSWLKWNRSAEQIGTERRRDRERKATGKVPESVPIPDGIPPDSLEWSGPVSGDGDHDTPDHSTPEPPAAPARAESDVNKRAQALAATYHGLVPLSRFPAILDVAKRAIKAGYDDGQIEAALRRLAEEGRSVTVDVLRVELEGQPASRRGPQSVLQREYARVQSGATP